MNYQDYLSECFQESSIKQAALEKKYELKSFSTWFYDQASGILTLSDKNKELNFRYFEVGTYSKKSNTWKWSWDNNHTLKKVKDKVELVKDFGTENEYTKLTHGEFESYKEEGWQFASITLKLLNGIGLYRPETDRHYIFLVLSELVDHGVAQEEKDKYVDCERHERRRRAFICQHLKNNSRNGFEEAFPTYEGMEFEYDDDDFQAWCRVVKK